MPQAATYPVRVEANLEAPLSRWLWLVKWVLAIPHFFVLTFLWMAYAILSVAAFFAILFTGRYPRSIFEFNVGVLRWSWRVAYYAYGALGTDRYPPFTLADDPDYPATLEVAYPERLSRGLVLVKWWLLAIPHYLVVGVFAGGGTWIAWQAGRWEMAGGGGLIGLLVLVAAIVLAFTGAYPTGLFDLILGMNRWVLRVAAYAGLMTDAYPPFRLDLGGSEPGGRLTVPLPPPPGGAPAAAGVPAVPGAPAIPRAVGAGWTAGRIVALVLGALLVMTSLGLLAGGGFALWADQARRDASNYVTTPSHAYVTGSHALVVRSVFSGAEGPRWVVPSGILGTVRLRVTPADPTRPMFVGIASTAQVDAYLATVGHATVRDFGSTVPRAGLGGGPAVAPADRSFWVASSAGTGTRTLTWPVRDGSWAVVAMNADGGPGVSVVADVGATLPGLLWVAVGLLAGGVLVLAIGVALVAGAARRASAPAPVPVTAAA